MKRFLLSDLHIGHDEAQYDIMERAMDYISGHAESGDEILGLGDWFHLYENGRERCLGHPATEKLVELARKVPTRLMTGNHDFELTRIQEGPNKANPISPIELIEPFCSNGYWYCHGHEYDPLVQYVPRPFRWIWSRLSGKKTPGEQRRDLMTARFLTGVYVIQAQALLSLGEIGEKLGRKLEGIVIGHTHLPVYLHQFSPEMLLLFNDGDMRQSGTFAVEHEDSFSHLTWDLSARHWLEKRVGKPRANAAPG